MGKQITDFFHRPNETTIPSDAVIWFDDAGGQGVPRRFPYSLITTAMSTPATGALRAVFLTAALQALSGAGAVNVTSYKTNFTSTGVGDALTLVDGTVLGQIKVITHIVDGGSGVLTPDNFANGAKITFTTVGEQATLIWDNTNWNAIDLDNVGASVATLPVIA